MRVLRVLRALGVLGVALSAPLVGAQQFEEVALEAGLSETQGPRVVPCALCPGRSLSADEFTGGAAVGDYDQDGDPDLFLTRRLLHDQLYENQGDGTFVDVAAQVGVAGDATLGGDAHSNGAAFVDVDRDGDLDLIVTRFGREGHLLYINDGTRDPEGRPRFVEQGAARGMGGGRGDQLATAFGVGVGDYDRDGWPDLFVTDWSGMVTCGQSMARLLRNRGATAPGVFEDQSEAAGLLAAGGRETSWSFGAAFADMDRDGWPDLLITADFGTSSLHFGADGYFTRAGPSAGVGTDRTGMGSSVADYDGDGDLDWFVSAIEAQGPDWEGEVIDGNRLYRNDGGRVFTDVTDLAGVRDAGWAWGAAFFDPDNDGDLDLVVTSGMEQTGVDTPCMRFFRNDGSGRFTERAAEEGLVEGGLGRALVVWDYDLDGDQDLLVTRNGQRPLLYRNRLGTTQGDALRVRVRGPAGEPAGWGARVRVARRGAPGQWTADVGLSSQFLGHSEDVLHFGLGPGVEAAGGLVDVHVRYVSGVERSLLGLSVNQSVEAREPLGASPRLPPAPPRAAPDCDQDGQPDACASDCDASGVPDACELRAGLLADCNANAVPDRCELALGLAEDADEDGVIDACQERTCDGPPDAGSRGPQGPDAAPAVGGLAGGSRSCTASAAAAPGPAASWLSVIAGLCVALWRRRGGRRGAAFVAVLLGACGDPEALPAPSPCLETASMCERAGAAGMQRWGPHYGRGIAVADIDQDGFDDVWVADSGSTMEGHTGRSHLLLNRGDGTFRPTLAGVAPEHLADNWGGVFADVDNDGDPDLLLVNGGFNAEGRLFLYRNDWSRDGRFVDVTTAAGLSTERRYWWGASFADYDRDGLLDFAVTSVSMGAGADGELAVYRNLGGGVFQEVSGALGLPDVAQNAKNPVWLDYDADGDADLFVAAAGPLVSALYRNDGVAGFTDVSPLVAFPGSETLLAFAASVIDFDQDGRDDLYLGRWNQQDLVLRNVDGAGFESLGTEAGIDTVGDDENTMGQGSGDVNGDGWPEVFLGPGEPHAARLPVVLCHQGAAARFARCSEDYVGPSGLSRYHGIALSDVDADGQVDVLWNRGGFVPYDAQTQLLPEPPPRTSDTLQLYRQQQTAPTTAQLRLHGTQSNRDAVGARVMVEGEARHHYVVGSAQGFVSQNSAWLTVALGASPSARVYVTWPSGTRSELVVERGQRVEVTEPPPG